MSHDKILRQAHFIQSAAALKPIKLRSVSNLLQELFLKHELPSLPYAMDAFYIDYLDARPACLDAYFERVNRDFAAKNPAG